MTYFILLVLFELVLMKGKLCACPTECRCMMSGVYVDCKKAKLTYIPSGIPNNTKVL